MTFGSASANAAVERLAQSGLSLPTNMSTGISSPARAAAVELEAGLGAQLARDRVRDRLAQLPEVRGGSQLRDLGHRVATDVAEELAHDRVAVAVLRSAPPSGR